MASDFLAKIGKTNRTINNYGTTLACVFRSAKDRDRFLGDNPFERHRRKVNKKTTRIPFEVTELQTLFDALPRKVKPTKHTPETALPWVTLIGTFTGMRLEEISQLKADATESGLCASVPDGKLLRANLTIPKPTSYIGDRCR